MNHCAALLLGRGNSICRVRAPCSPELLQPPSSQGLMWCKVAKHCCPAQWYHMVVLPGRTALQSALNHHTSSPHGTPPLFMARNGDILTFYGWRVPVPLLRGHGVGRLCALPFFSWSSAGGKLIATAWCDLELSISLLLSPGPDLQREQISSCVGASATSAVCSETKYTGG